MRADTDLGLRCVAETITSRSFEWRLDAGLSRNLADLVVVLVHSDGPSHPYLDSPDGDDATVVVSTGEYPPHFG